MLTDTHLPLEAGSHTERNPTGMTMAMPDEPHHIPPDTLLPFSEASRRVGLGRTSIYAGIAAGTFPKPVKIGTRSLWVEREINVWITAQIKVRDMGRNMGRTKGA